MSLSVENLYLIGDDATRQGAYDLFVRQMQSAAPVHSVFFNNIGPVGGFDAAFVNPVAIALVCSAISRSSLYRFSATIDQPKADSFWATRLDGSGGISAGQANYRQLFGSAAYDGTSFAEYLPQGASWAASLAKMVTTNPFINTTMAKMMANDKDWRRRLNLVLYKLDRLDANTVQPVLATWRAAYPNENITIEWPNYNYISAFRFQGAMFLGEVNAAISVRTVQGLGRQTLYIWGNDVAEFERKEARALGLWTTVPAGNTMLCPPECPDSGCFAAGTPLHLADGTIPIQNVRVGDAVLSHGGRTSEHGHERVIVEFEAPQMLFGINDYDPFFVGAHPFLTPEGWKCINPNGARDQNPMLEFGTLAEGDVVYQLESTDPCRYREVKIERITSRAVPAGTRVYSVYLMGERTFHVHGFVVSTNYPMITAARLMQGFARLTPEERAVVAEAILPVMPMLTAAIGRFIEAPIRRALEQ